MTRMSDEQFRIFIETIKALASVKEKEPVSKGDFRKCTAKFSGVFDYGWDEIGNFITVMEAYKELEGIRDEDALKVLSLRLSHIALIWWKGVRRNVTTWQSAMQLMRDHFSSTKRSYIVYKEIFRRKQRSKEPIDDFVIEQRSLLGKLPESRHDEATKLDFVYGLLQPRYRKIIPRHEIKTFQDLLERGRRVERDFRLYNQISTI